MVDVARIAKITRQLYERERFAYLLVDHNWHVIEASDNFCDYGFPQVPEREDARDHIDFLVGMNSQSTLDLPIVMSPSDHPLHVVLLPEEDVLTIVLMDASRDFEQRQLLQQKANENALLVAEQERLMDDLAKTQENLLEKNRELKEASRLQTSFLSGVSHEFRTPLASMRGYLDLLSERFAHQSEAENRKQLEVVTRSANHLLTLVENLLDHGKLDAEEMVLNPGPVNLSDALSDVESLFANHRKNSQVDMAFCLTPPQPPLCYLDSSRLRQILINIVGNAIKFTDKGYVKVHLNWAANQLDIEVSDTGIGISESHLERVGQPFWQVPRHGRAGTGLGLTITERICEMMGGELRIRSKLGQGTTVSISMPAMAIDGEALSMTGTARESASGRRFLLAEDDSDIAELLTLLLQELGVEVTHVENGEQVVPALKRQHYDLVLLDIQMPIMDGYEAAKRVRAAGFKLPILIMTASAIETDGGRAEEAGCDGYLVKPVDVTELLILAEQLLLDQEAVRAT